MFRTENDSLVIVNVGQVLKPHHAVFDPADPAHRKNRRVEVGLGKPPPQAIGANEKGKNEQQRTHRNH
mgnify:CR=1 FL=1